MPNTSLERKEKSQELWNVKICIYLCSHVWEQLILALRSVSIPREEPGFSCLWHSGFLTALGKKTDKDLNDDKVT